jgi:diguanylate cyclase (GGDEF)-like protein
MAQSNRVSRDGNRRILVVDDVATNVRLLSGYLSREGYRVSVASDGEEALRSIEQLQPDLVLLDIMMPGIDGFETCRRIRADESTRHIPVILVTALNELDHKVRGQEAGADDFIAKPFDRDELIVRVRSMLRIKALHDRLNQKIAELESAKIRLRRLADTDALTSLYNKRYLQEGLRIEVSRSKRYKNSLSMLMVDVDHFKKINDQEGHPTGDSVLQQLATTLVNGVRSIDIVARYGGEEFAVVLPETTQSGAALVAERLRETVERQRFLDDQGEPLHPISISIGIASLDSSLESCEALIKAADDALYEAKRLGRNRCFADGRSQISQG